MSNEYNDEYDTEVSSPRHEGCRYFNNKTGERCGQKPIGVRELTIEDIEAGIPETSPDCTGSDRYCYRHQIFETNWPNCANDCITDPDLPKNKVSYNARGATKGLCHWCIEKKMGVKKVRRDSDEKHYEKPKTYRAKETTNLNLSEPVVFGKKYADAVKHADSAKKSDAAKFSEFEPLIEEDDSVKKLKEQMAALQAEYEKTVAKVKAEKIAEANRKRWEEIKETATEDEIAHLVKAFNVLRKRS